MFTDIIWRFLVLESFVVGALCCDCPYEHPQKHFCEREFVLYVHINEEVKVPVRPQIKEEIKLKAAKAFRVEIGHSFKGDVRNLHILANRSAVLLMHPECPVVSMKTGDTYIIFGDNDMGNIYTMDCYGNMPWDQTTRFQSTGLERFYKKGCDCVPRSKDTITRRKCKSKYSFMFKSDNTCKWYEHRSFNLCEYGLLKDTGRKVIIS